MISEFGAVNFLVAMEKLSKISHESSKNILWTSMNLAFELRFRDQSFTDAKKAEKETEENAVEIKREEKKRNTDARER